MKGGLLSGFVFTEDGLVVGQLEKVLLARQLELDLKGLFGDLDAYFQWLVMNASVSGSPPWRIR